MQAMRAIAQSTLSLTSACIARSPAQLTPQPVQAESESQVQEGDAGETNAERSLDNQESNKEKTSKKMENLKRKLQKVHMSVSPLEFSDFDICLAPVGALRIIWLCRREG